VFDVVIIGAGISGSASAYFLTRSGLKVALMDKEEIAAGGSGAAGAFISPKISKGGPLKALVEEAYLYALDFYNDSFPEHITNASQLHIAKYSDDNAKVIHFKEHTKIVIGETPQKSRLILSEFAKSFESVFIKKSGIVDAQKMCQALASEATFFKEEVKVVTETDQGWQAGSIAAKKIILATGAYIPVLKEPYITLRGIWGHRIDIRTSTTIPHIIHHQVSLSPSTKEGLAAIGATHDVHYHPQKTQMPYDVEAGRKILIQKATESVMLSDIEVLNDFTGLRSGSNDYLPLLGRVVDAKKSLEKHPELRKGAKIAKEKLSYHRDLYMINGTGGYGFVLGPFLAKQLSRHIVHAEPMDDQLDPTRFLFRWAKRVQYD